MMNDIVRNEAAEAHDSVENTLKETPDDSHPFGLSLSKPSIPRAMPFDKLRANGTARSFSGQAQGEQHCLGQAQGEQHCSELSRNVLATIGGFPHIILRGAGNAGQQMLDYLLAEGMPKEKFCFWDRRAEYVREISGIPVLPPFSGNFPSQDTIILHCISAPSLPYSAEHYTKHGYTAHMDGFALLCPYQIGTGQQLMACHPGSYCALIQCPRHIEGRIRYTPHIPNTGRSAEILLADRLFFSINTKCTLKCRHCIHYINNFPPEKSINFPLARILDDINIVCAAYDFIRILALEGGEPFLHPHFARIIAHSLSQSNVGMIQIYSSGICRISEKTMTVLQNARIHLRIPFYIGILDEKLKTIRDKNLCKLKLHGVSYSLYQTQWNLAPTLIKQNRSIAVLQNIKQHCSTFHECRTISNGIYYPCRHAVNIALHNIADYTHDKIFLNSDLSQGALREQIITLIGHHYYQSCDHCDLKKEDVVPGEQGVDARYAHIGKINFINETPSNSIHPETVFRQSLRNQEE